MKALKNTRRGNFRVDTTYYTEDGLNYLLSEGVIDKLGEDHYIVNVSDSKSVKVKYSEIYDDYVTIVKTNTGYKIHISL